MNFALDLRTIKIFNQTRIIVRCKVLFLLDSTDQIIHYFVLLSLFEHLLHFAKQKIIVLFLFDLYFTYLMGLGISIVLMISEIIYESFELVEILDWKVC